MPRNITVAYKAWLAGDSLTMAVCVLLTRVDGTTMGFTSCDIDLVFGGVTFEASNAITGSAVKSAVGTGVDNMEVIGLLRSDRIREVDILAGMYDGAALELFLLNYNDLTMGELILLKGLLGEVRTQDGQFTAEIRGVTQRLGQHIGELCCATCQVVRLGDLRCKVDMTTRRFNLTIGAVIDQMTFNVTGTNAASVPYYTNGVMKYTTGQNAGYEREIKLHVSLAGPLYRLTMQEAFPYPVLVGDTPLCEQGCDRLPGTCTAFFNNIINFRGQPNVPGQTQIITVGRSGL